MCSVPLDLFSMLELGGQQPSSAMISMNQLTTGQHLANRRTGRKKTTGIPNPKRMFEEVRSDWGCDPSLQLVVGVNGSGEDISVLTVRS